MNRVHEPGFISQPCRCEKGPCGRNKRNLKTVACFLKTFIEIECYLVPFAAIAEHGEIVVEVGFKCRGRDIVNNKPKTVPRQLRDDPQITVDTFENIRVERTTLLQKMCTTIDFPKTQENLAFLRNEANRRMESFVRHGGIGALPEIVGQGRTNIDTPKLR